MKVEYLARNCVVEAAVRRYSEDKLHKVERFLEEPLEAHVTIEQTKHLYVVEVKVAHRLGLLQAEESASQMLDAVNQAVDKLETQAQRAHEKLVGRRRRAQRAQTNGHEWPLAVIARDSVGAGPPRIIESSLLQIKPMSIEEAALELESAPEDFVVFRDSETNRLSVLYERRDGNYGLIAPEF